MNKKVNKKVAIGVAAGIAGITTGAIVALAARTVVDVIACEMRHNSGKKTFTSPEGNHTVALDYGTSATANGLTRIVLVAADANKEDTCKFVAYARKSPYMFQSEWIDNDHFKLWIGCKSRKQCCDVTFVNGKITTKYYLCKVGKTN